MFYDISASPQGRSVDRGWVERVSRLIDIPFCVAGGIRDVGTARRVLHAGADKISVNSPALERPLLVSELADAFGATVLLKGNVTVVADPGGPVYLSPAGQSWADTAGSGDVLSGMIGGLPPLRSTTLFFALVIAWKSPVKCRLICSIGTTWA